MERRWISGLIVVALLVAIGFLMFGDRLAGVQGPRLPPETTPPDREMRKRTMARRWITGVIVMVLLVAAWLLAFGDRLVSGQGPATPPPEATELPAVTASDEIVADGKVVPVRSAALSLSTGGIVADVPVTEGERVEAGEVLVRL